MTTKTLVFGGSGFIGKTIIANLKLLEQEYISINSHKCNLLNLEKTNNYISNLPKDEYNIIILSTIPKSKILNLVNFKQNISIVNNVLSSIRQLSVKSIIYFSSVDVYGENPKLPITEKTNLNPNDYYGMSKVISEYSVFNYKTETPKLILRLPGVYGSKNDKFSIIEKFSSSIIKGNEIIIEGDGNQLRDYVYIDDINKIISMFYYKPVNGIYNFVTGNSISVLAIIKIISSILKIEPNIAYMKKNNRYNDLIYNNAKFLNKFNGFEFINIKFGIEEYLKQK